MFDQLKYGGGAFIQAYTISLLKFDQLKYGRGAFI